MSVVGVRIFAGRVWRDDSLCTAFCEPVAEAPSVVSSVRNKAQRARHNGQQSAGAIEIMGVAWGELECERAPLFVGQGMDLRRAPAT
jgi:hypothetical protein